MANYYTTFSFEIQNITPQEEQWLTRQFKKEDEYACILFPDFQCETEPNGQRNFWIHDDEGCSDRDLLATTLQSFLSQYRPSQSIGFSWADTCSKPRLDSFGGGAVFITTHEISWFTTWDWLSACATAPTVNQQLPS